jgi:monoamine oxidase
MSGLVAARILQDTGFSVLVLEARDRLGGRIWTDEKIGIPCDLGASWIHGADQNPLTLWCKSLGIKPLVFPEGHIWFFNGGYGRRFSELLWKARHGIGRAFMAFFKDRSLLWMKGMFSENEDTSLGTLLGPVLSYPYRHRVNWQVLTWLVRMVEAVEGAPIDELSLINFDPFEYHQMNMVPEGGFAKLIQEAASGLEIQLGAPARRIVWGSDGVKVITRENTYSGDLVLISVPLGVLKCGHIQFEPGLPRQKIAAIGRIGYGGQAVLNKIVFHFSERLWPDNIGKMACLPDDPVGCEDFHVWMDLQPLVGLPVITGFSSGRNAATLDQNTSDEEICQQALSSLRRMLSPSIPEPISYRLTRWLTDPWSRGSYSYAAVKSTNTDRQSLSEPVGGRLFFAGEAAHENHYGTVHGALLSGEREAFRIHRRYCCPQNDRSCFPWCRTA